MLPNVSPKLFSLSAVAIGYLLIDDSTASEQNALGNWLMLVAQVLSTNAYYKSLLQERNYNNSKVKENSSSNFFNNSKCNNEYDETICMLEKMISAFEKELNNVKSKMSSEK